MTTTSISPELIYLLIWAAVVLAIVLITARRTNASVGLPLAYIVVLSLAHTPGAVLDQVGMIDEYSEYTKIGFQQTVYGMVAFLGGVAIAYASSARSRRRPLAYVVDKRLDSSQFAILDRVGLDYIVTGAIAYFLLGPLIGDIGTVNAVLSSLGALLLAGLSLRLWVAQQNSNSIQFWITIAAVPLFPLYTLVNSGFIGAAMVWIAILASFLFAQSKRKWAFYVCGPIFIFLGLSFCTSYLMTRNEIRETVWVEKGSTSDRLAKVFSIFNNFQWLDFKDPDQADVIEKRLNQNWIVGLGVQRLDAGEASFNNGASFGAMVIALVPRAIWPEKPQVGGGGDLVTRITGVYFAEGTSVGIGQVLEFYWNFGLCGLLAGFTLWGWLLGYCDRRAALCLRQADHAGFVFWFIVAVALINPAGNLLEIEVGAVSAALAAQGLSLFITQRAHSRHLKARNIRSPETSRYLRRQA